jgi:drug/metabolite transporter (DMT)-like permease
MTPATRGAALVLGAGLVWSTAGILVRAMAAAEAWQIVFYRSLWLAATIAVYLLWRYGGRAPGRLGAIGWPGLLGGASLGIGFCGYVFAMTHTTIANAQFLLAVSPFTVSLIAWAVLGERIVAVTWLAMAAALAGVAIMVIDALGEGRAFGNAMAMVAVAGFSVFTVTLRVGRRGDMTPSLCVAGLVAAGIAAVMIDDFALSARDHVLCMLLGSVQIGLGMVLFTLGSRLVPAGPLALLSLIEIVVGPFLVWLVFAEVPTMGTLIGGAVVIGAIVAQSVHAMRQGFGEAGA